MKRTTAWAVVNKRGTLMVRSHFLPVFWLKKVAQEFADEFHGVVIKVAVDEVYT
jgi:hypothetical protein